MSEESLRKYAKDNMEDGGESFTKYWSDIANGQFWKGSLHIRLSRIPKKLLRHTRPKSCYQNCKNIALNTRLRYVEGIATAPIITPHAWLLDTDGRIYEATLLLLHKINEVAYLGTTVEDAWLKKPQHEYYSPLVLRSIGDEIE